MHIFKLSEKNVTDTSEIICLPNIYTAQKIMLYVDGIKKKSIQDKNEYVKKKKLCTL